MFSSKTIYENKTFTILTNKQSSLEVDSQSEEIPSPLLKSRSSLTSTIDSPIISPRKSTFELIDQDFKQICSDFQANGFCLMGLECHFLHKIKTNKWKNIIWLQKYPELLFEIELERRNSFLQ